jgi:glucose/arabinose dehydrogenase
MRSAAVVVCCVAAWLLAGCRQLTTAGEAGVTVTAPAVPIPETVVRGLREPVDLAFLSPDVLLVAEAQPARIRWVERGVLRAAPFAALPDARLTSLAVAPNYPHPPHVYACTGQRVVRFTVAKGVGTAPTTIIDGLPGGGGRLLFARDGALLVTTGDNGHPDWAQDYTRLDGKVLRYAADGRIPDDNPLEQPKTRWAGRGMGQDDDTPDETKTPIYAVGLRNPVALALHPDTGAVFVMDTGPERDALSRLTPGDNYALPAAGADDPHFHPAIWSGRGIGPVDAVFYSGSEFPLFAGELFFTAVDGKLRRVLLHGQATQVREVTNLGVAACQGIAMGPEGRLYFADHTTVYRLRIRQL